MMSDPVRILERLTLVTPLGVQFWDEVSGSIIADGLSVTTYPASNPARRVPGFPNRSGTYVMQNLPGLRDFENGAGDAEFWDNLDPLSRLPFVIEVVDYTRRFQPFLFSADLPVRGLFTLECVSGSPPDKARPVVPLYSAPSRAVPGGMAVLRSTLWNPLVDAPAAWAMLEGRINGRPPIRGFADDQGRIALIFPYPEPVDFVDFPESGSPPSMAAGLPLTQQTWSIQLQAMYDTPLSTVPPIPDLCTTLTQSPAILWSDSARTQHLSQVTLKFGQELVVRSEDASTHTPQPVLFITPAV